jgi:hypothetical protein
MNKQLKGKTVIVTTEATTKRGRVIKATMKVDSQAKNHIYIRTEANRDYRESKIHFSHIDELRTFKKMIEELETEYENHKKFLNK